jgi:membrane protease YdiL (CAAX protease family)
MVVGWVVLVLAMPVVAPASISLLIGTASAGGFEAHVRGHERWLYVALATTIAAVLIAAGPVELGSLGRPVRGVAVDWLPATASTGAVLFGAAAGGAALYRLDTALVVWQTGEPVGRGDRSLAAVMPLLLSPLPEEILFRAGLEPLVDMAGSGLYVCASALVFGLVHAPSGRREVALKTGNGVVYALSYLLSGTVLIPVAAHFGYNTLAARTLLAD